MASGKAYGTSIKEKEYEETAWEEKFSHAVYFSIRPSILAYGGAYYAKQSSAG